MEYPYTIKSLASKVGKTEQSLQKFLKKNSQFVNQHTFQSGRFKRYDQAVMDLVADYYKLPQEVTAASDPDEPSVSEELEKQDDSAERISELETELEQARKEIEDLKSQLSSAEEERKEMVRQNASLLLLLQEEKQEKMLLLPAPKKTLRQKLRDIFSGSSGETQKNSPNKD